MCLKCRKSDNKSSSFFKGEQQSVRKMNKKEDKVTKETRNIIDFLGKKRIKPNNFFTRYQITW